jgi:hypothetical protein
MRMMKFYARAMTYETAIQFGVAEFALNIFSDVWVIACLTKHECAQSLSINLTAMATEMPGPAVNNVNKN